MGRDRLGDLARPAVDEEVFLALADRSRRIALYYLRWRRRVDVDELADVVAGWRGADRIGAVSRADRDRVRASLLGHHLPVLVDAGLVELVGEGERGREREAASVELESLSEPVRSLIDFAYEAEGEEGGPNPRS